MQDRACGDRDHRDQNKDIRIRKPALGERHQGLRKSRHDVVRDGFSQAHGLIVRCIRHQSDPPSGDAVTAFSPIDCQSASVRSVSGTAWQARHRPSLASTGPRWVNSPSTTSTAQLSHCPTRQPLGSATPAALAASSSVPCSGRHEKLCLLPASRMVRGARLAGTAGGDTKLSAKISKRGYRAPPRPRFAQ